jgi:hypothetical protein
MAGNLAETGPAVPDHHRSYLLEQRLDRVGFTARRERGQILETGLLLSVPYAFYLQFCLSCLGQRPDGAPLSHDGIMPR